MRTLHSIVGTLSLSIVVLSAGVVSGQDYPNKPIRLYIAEAGGPADFIGRLVAQGLTGLLGQPVIVENRPSRLLGEIVSKAPPDGYTLLINGGTFTFGPLLEKAAYDPLKNFSPITLTDSSPNILVVHPSVPVKSVKELLALAKAKPGALNYASGANGASTHLAAELFTALAGVKIVRINYKGNASAVKDLLSGEVQLMFPSAGPVTADIKLGKLRALAVTSAHPTTLVPGLPTIAASGLPGYESTSTHGAFAPAGTPKQVINKLNEEIVRVLNKADVKEKFLNLGVETIGSSPEQYVAWIKSETAKWSEVFKSAGIRPE